MQDRILRPDDVEGSIRRGNVLERAMHDVDQVVEPLLAIEPSVGLVLDLGDVEAGHPAAIGAREVARGAAVARADVENRGSGADRAEKRRVGKRCGSKLRSWWGPYQ